MSYPSKLRILIVEDEDDTIAAYKVTFAGLRDEFEFDDPSFVRCYADALSQINGSSVFHVVILDMNLPVGKRESPEEGLTLGEGLLGLFARRDHHPIPVVLVVTGKLNLAKAVGGILAQLKDCFWHGDVVNKGSDEQTRSIRVALEKARQYVAIGIHIRDSGTEWFPTLSPREDDLLRRCVLHQNSCDGVDLRWWSAESGESTSRPSPNKGPTKVLMGFFILERNLGQSLPTFFKFEPAGNSPYVCDDLAVLSQKLGHVKPLFTLESHLRALIVTQSVTNSGLPVTLNEYLQRSDDETLLSISDLAHQICAQLQQLGSSEDDLVTVGSLFWDYLRRHEAERAWRTCEHGVDFALDAPSPLATYDALLASPAKIWATRRNCTHGDLNATNVAVDVSEPKRPRAYIFDAAGVRADYAFRDVATLEVTTMLFNSATLDTTLRMVMDSLYGETFCVQDIAEDATPFAKNLCSMVKSFRGQIEAEDQVTAYAVLVFDAALRQLFGLAVQPSPNKVRNPMHACWIAAAAAGWLRRICPMLFAENRTTSGLEGV